MCERGLRNNMSDIDKEKICCFFGHRKVDETEELKNKLYEIIENLIITQSILKTPAELPMWNAIRK